MAKKQRGPAVTAIVLLTQRFGFRKATWIMEFLAKWALAVRANGWEPIDAEAYAEYWGISRATGYRDQSIWRNLFPDEPTPNERILAGRADYEAAMAEHGKDPSMNEVAALFCSLPAA